MAAGDRFFGPNEATGQEAGTGALIPIVLDFAPQSVTVENRTNGSILKWQKGMPEGSGILISGGSVSLNSTIEPLTGLAATFFWVNLGVGLFVLGETITGGTSGATGTVAFPNTDNQDDLGLTGIVGAFEVGETITGGTSGATANLASAPFSVYEPTSAVACFSGASLPIGGPLTPSAGFVINPILSVTYDTLVGTFQVGEQVVGGTSTNSMFVINRLAGKLDGLQVIWTAGAGFTLGETITGSISGATAVVTSCSFPYQVVYRAPSGQWSNGRFAVFSPINISAGSIIVSYVGSNAISGTTTVSYIATDGITSGNSGFYIGANPSINSGGSIIYYEAQR